VGPRAGVDGCGKFHPNGIFLFSVLYLYFFVLIVLDFAFCPLLYNTHNTNIHALDGIRTRNSSKRSAADPRLRPLGHWDRQRFDRRNVQLVASRLPTELSRPDGLALQAETGNLIL
jgi:hypothetical protein